jgi:hypothetical protein
MENTVRKIKSPSTLISLTLLLFLNVISCSKKELTDKELFERYIAAPMPESVKTWLSIIQKER